MLQLINPKELQNLSVQELAGLLGLIDLLGILILLQGGSAAQSKGNQILQQALKAVLQGSEGKETSFNPAELAGTLGKNSALFNTLLNLLLSSKEIKPKEKETPEGKPDEEPHRVAGRGR
ncbi:hypothetical protein SAMN00808754_0429 [Thermanaeromonas toyohensis ToBE]|uniref:Uncharacterized protein n=1 Tax=Thermanaeromonas toyohensis ToBE TaxID=698762 RepID=A0A1W1VDU5_9FIRM|nr:hypothetical protein [Thermanaeromonas toyohensis]SMB91370.1 hypothetical protein SAMN00808754_0429 [Thermanaeromonas toyohensis ToBE]